MGGHALKTLLLCLIIHLPVALHAGTGDVAAAWQDVAYLDYRRAAPHFEAVRKSAVPGSREWHEATLGFALCLHQRQPDVKSDKEAASELYDALIAATDGNEIQATALLLRGKLAQLIDYYGDEEDFEAAAGFYRRILSDWPDSKCADEAALYLAQCSFFSMDREEAGKAADVLEKWLAAHKASRYASSHWLLLALAHRMPLENQAAAVDASIKAVEAGLPKEIALDEVYWRIATMAKNSGRNEIARDFYARIIVEVQRSRYTYSAWQCIREMGYEPPDLVDPFE
jgi:tetratricopeptide (TPR) repeat protein